MQRYASRNQLIQNRATDDDDLRDAAMKTEQYVSAIPATSNIMAMEENGWHTDSGQSDAVFL
jgi:hypothetical protein